VHEQEAFTLLHQRRNILAYGFNRDALSAANFNHNHAG
jgi:hypothetical protein